MRERIPEKEGKKRTEKHKNVNIQHRMKRKKINHLPGLMSKNQQWWKIGSFQLISHIHLFINIKYSTTESK